MYLIECYALFIDSQYFRICIMAVSFTIPPIVFNLLVVGGVGLYVYMATLAWIVALFPSGSGLFGQFETRFKYPNNFVKIPTMVLTAPGALVGFLAVGVFFGVYLLFQGLTQRTSH